MELTLGVVQKNYDDHHPGMVEVTLPTFAAGKGETAWLPVLSPYAGKGYGLYIRPEKDDQVLVGFLDGDVMSGVVLGSLWNGKNTHPRQAIDEKNLTRVFITKGGHTVTFTDGDEGLFNVETAKGYSIDINEKDKKIKLATGDGKQSVTVDEGKGSVDILADKAISLKAKEINLNGALTAKGKDITLSADTNLNMKGKQLKIEGSASKFEAQNAEFKGAMLTVEASGVLTLKGAMTKIN